MSREVFEIKDNLPAFIKGYRLFQAISCYPEIRALVPGVFLKVMEQRLGLDRAFFSNQASSLKESIKEMDLSEEEIEDILILIYFAYYFEFKEVENYITLARKKHAFRQLSRIVNKEGATFGQIRQALKAFCEIPEGELYISPNEAEGVRVALINYFISNQLAFISVAKKHITIRDIEDILQKTYRSRRRPGRIGGKAAGMYLAYRILVPRLTLGDPELKRYISIPESYYFNSGIFSEFIDYNELYEFHSQKYKTLEELQRGYEEISFLFEKARFPEDMVETFRAFLIRVGEHPLILRSSSLLEDNFGYAFSGKYDSVFLANQGPVEERLEDFIRGLKRVHMSTYSPAAIIYRRDHNLLDFDEKMSVLVQKVVGRKFGRFFFPFAAGVAFSYSSYTWSPRIKKEEGMVRLVFGLGTRAVDRVATDYPRMVYLSHPLLRPEVEANEICKYSQKFVDVIDLQERGFATVPLGDFLREVKHPDLFYAVSMREGDGLYAPMFKTEKIDPKRVCITFENFLTKTPFVRLMKKSLCLLEDAYGRPVDVEFAWDGNRLYILQCRSLSVTRQMDAVEIPSDIPQEDIVFTTHKVLNNCKVEDIEIVVYVDPKAYAGIDKIEEKIEVGRVVGRLNRRLENKRFALFGPGRWGSNDINLGVKVNYEDINRTTILAEVAFEEGGSTPEVSFGTHFFSDLVEAHIIPIAIFPDHKQNIFKEDFFTGSRNILSEILPGDKRFEEVIHVIDVPHTYAGKFLHVYQNSVRQYGMGFLRGASGN